MKSLGKAVSGMKRAGHMFAKGGECSACGGGKCMYWGGTEDASKSDAQPQSDASPSNPYGNTGSEEKRRQISDSFNGAFSKKYAKGGYVKGVHKPASDDKDIGESETGSDARALHHTKKRNDGYELDEREKDRVESMHDDVRAGHEDVIRENRKINPKLKGLAHGGMVKGVHKSAMDVEKPENKREKSWAGESESGESLRNSDLNKSSLQKAKDGHNKVLGEMKSINPKMKGLAHGGKVFGTDMDAAQSKAFMDKGEHTGEYAEGGDVEHEMMEHCAGELIKAIETKNKSEMLDAIKAIVLSLKG